ncbi:(Fe-S)-binding protein [Acidobacteriota bacterium]
MDKQNETLLQRAKNEMEKRFNRLVGLSSSNLCVRCGLCVDACHYILSDGKDLAVSPVAKAERIRSVYKSHHDWLSKVFPWWTGAKKLTEAELEEWREVAFKNCSMCQRCTVNCPLGVDIPAIMGAARSTLASLDMAPEMLTMLADMAISREENLDSFKESFVKGIKEMEKQLREDTGDPEASIPLEVQGADFLYVPLSGAHTILPAAKIFNKAKQSWTMSMFEAANYGIFLQDKERSKKIADRVVNEAKRLGVKEVIITECGHAYTTFRWTAPSWYDEPWPFKVRNLIEVIDEYLQKGRIKVDPDKIKGSFTLHDSCNLARNSGIIEEPRRIVKSIIQDFREMTPNKERNLCCGGGGGLVANPEWEETRLKAGKSKADQIKATGAENVIASCDNCLHQLGEIGDFYKLDTKVTGLSELVSKAMF